MSQDHMWRNRFELFRIQLGSQRHDELPIWPLGGGIDDSSDERLADFEHTVQLAAKRAVNQRPVGAQLAPVKWLLASIEIDFMSHVKEKRIMINARKLIDLG